MALAPAQKVFPLLPLPRPLTVRNRNDTIYALSWCDGRLGNVISVFATFYAYQKDYGIIPLPPRFLSWLICYYFECHEKIQVLENELPNWRDYSWPLFDPDVKGSLATDNGSTPNPELGHYLDIGKYANKLKNYFKYMTEMKKSFLTLKSCFQENARKSIELAIQQYEETHTLLPNDTIEFIGIHARYEDYSDKLKQYGLQLVNESYFTRAMSIFRTSIKNPLFIIVSNDMAWAKREIIPINNDCVFQGTGIQSTDPYPPNMGITPVVASAEIGNDLALLSKMNYSILTYGTYGMWGALLAESKMVVMPAGYDNHDITKEILAANISGWITV